MEVRLEQTLDRRRSQGTLRSLASLEELERQYQQKQQTARNDESTTSADDFLDRRPPPDFSSNDYLGLARCPLQHERVAAAYQRLSTTTTTNNTPLGATGSRLLSGDSLYCRHLEDWLANLHNRPCSLVCNSGYDANLCITSCIPANVIVLDELCHNSIYMGIRWNKTVSTITTFRHSDVQDLTRILQQKDGEGALIMVIVESVYSMDGDVAPLEGILEASKAFGAHVVVDEAHGLGIYGRTNRFDLCRDCAEQHDSGGGDDNSVGGTGVLAALELESHSSLLCSVHTFGKAAGCHGAVLCCASPTLRDYLLNYARPFIYSTALPLHSLVSIRCSYETMIGKDGDERRCQVFSLVKLFRRLVERMLAAASTRMMTDTFNIALSESHSPIQALLVPGNNVCIEFCHVMQQCHGITMYPIRSPTVAEGQERVRIILHAHNSASHVTHLVECIDMTLRQMMQRRRKILSRL